MCQDSIRSLLQIKLLAYEHRKDAVGVGEQAMANTHTHTQTYTHSVPRDSQGTWSLGQGLDERMTHVRVAPPLITPCVRSAHKG